MQLYNLQIYDFDLAFYWAELDELLSKQKIKYIDSFYNYLNNVNTLGSWSNIEDFTFK